MNNLLQVPSNTLNYRWKKSEVGIKYNWSKNQIAQRTKYCWSQNKIVKTATGESWNKYTYTAYENPLFASWVKEQISNTVYRWETYNFNPAGTVKYHWNYGFWNHESSYYNVRGSYDSLDGNAHPQGKVQSPYHGWERYSVVSTTQWQLTQGVSTQTTLYNIYSNYLQIWSSKPTIDSSTGQYSGAPYIISVQAYLNEGYFISYPWFAESSGTYSNIVYHLYGIDPYGYIVYDKSFYKEQKTVKSKGEFDSERYYENEQYNKPDTLPANGIAKDSSGTEWWYVYIGYLNYWYTRTSTTLSQAEKTTATGDIVTSYTRAAYSDDGYNLATNTYTVYKDSITGENELYYRYGYFVDEMESRNLYYFDTEPILDTETGLYTIPAERTLINDSDNLYGKYLTEEAELTSVSQYYYGTELSYFTDQKLYNLLSYTTRSTLTTADGYGVFAGFIEEDEDYLQQEIANTILKDEFIEVITDDVGEFPKEGIDGDYWYSSLGVNYTYSQGQYVTLAKDYYLDTYPADGMKGDYWYTRLSLMDTTEQYQGEFIESVSSLSIDTYPTDGIDGNYWYCYLGTEFFADTLIEFITSPFQDSYPQNDKDGDYWYEYIGSFYPSLYEINDSHLVGGVKYTQEIQAATDFAYGVAAAGELVFTIRDDNNLSNYYINQYFTYKVKQLGDSDYRTVGKFKIVSAEKKKNNVELVAYDAMIEFEKNADDWIKSISYPITVSNYTTALSNFVGVPIVLGNGITNTNMLIKNNFEGAGITARMILQYIAQVVCGFAVVDTSGVVYIKPLQATQTAINNTQYVALSILENPVEKIDKVQAKVLDNDIGIIVGNGTNAYIIENNPLLYAETDAEKRQYITNIYNKVKDITYYPSEIDLINDQGINVGEYFTVNEQTTLCLKKEWDQSGVKISCDGNQYRESQTDDINTSIKALRGVTNTLKRTIEETDSTISNVQGDVSSINQKVDGLKLSVSNGQSSSTLSLKAGNTTLSSANITLNGMVTFNDLAGTSGKNTLINGGLIQTGQIDADLINFKTGYLSDYNGSTGYQRTYGIGLSTYGGGLVAASNYGAKIEFGSSQVYVDSNTAELKAQQCLANGNSIATNSDRKLKKDFDYDLSKYEEFYKDLKPVEYTFKFDEQEKRQTGFIAQEVLENLEDKGLENNGLYIYSDDRVEDGKVVREGRAYLCYNNFIALNTMMIQKLQKRIEELEKKVKELEAPTK